MALIEEFDKSGNWLFRWRSFLPLVLYILAFMVILSGDDQHMDHRDFNWSMICLAVSLLGVLVRGITIGYTPRGTSGRNTKEGQVAEVLNTKGIYSACRHPLYLGNFFMWMGIVMYVGNWWFTLAVCLLFWLYYERIMFAEEYFLRKKFGGEYLQWAKTAPPFWPRFRKWKKSGVRFSFKNVLKREYNGWFATFLSFALLNAMKNYLIFREWDYKLLLDSWWFYLLIFGVSLFLILRLLKKRTRVLDVVGREYV